jgi:phenylacetic acid degradation operon negative regulatory protein
MGLRRGPVSDLVMHTLEHADDGLPRAVLGSSPQHLLITVLGDYWLTRKEHLPSAALVSLLEEFGTTAASARSALSRLRRRALIEASKSGTRTYYGLSPSVAERVRAGTSRIMSFGLTEDWDGEWRLVAYSLPEGRREVRHVLRSRLRWMGFAPLFDGVYVSPSADAGMAAQLLAELNVESATVLRAVREVDLKAGRRLIDAWDIDALAKQYEEFVSECEETLVLHRRGDLTASVALRARTSVMDTYRRFPGLDPDLPAQLLPPDWPRAQARTAFLEVYDGLAPLAEIRVKQIIAVHDPVLAELAHCHISSSSLDLYES